MTTSSSQAGPLRLSVSLVCFHSDPVLLRQTLHSLRAAVVEAGSHVPLQCTLTVIDNGQQAQLLRTLLDECGWQQAGLISNPHNDGFGRANNKVIRSAASDFHLVLNPDVILAPDALSVGLQHFRSHAEAVALSPACRNAQGSIESLCKRYPSLRILLLRGFAPQWLKQWCKPALAHYECEDLLAREQPVAVPLISGCFMLCRTAALKSSGGFDERYFLYFEDFALSLMLGRKGELQHVPQCRIVHHGGNAAGKGLRHILLFAESAWRFYRQFGWKVW